MGDRVTQAAIEAAGNVPGAKARATQLAIEAAGTITAAKARVTQIIGEFAVAPTATKARITMLALEYAVGPAVIIPAPQGAAAEGDCEGTILVTTRSTPLATVYLLERSADGLLWEQIAAVPA